MRMSKSIVVFISIEHYIVGEINELRLFVSTCINIKNEMFIEKKPVPGRNVEHKTIYDMPLNVLAYNTYC